MKKLRAITILILVSIAINALAAGYSFMTDPSGKGLGMSVYSLMYSPFSDFFIPGLVLFVANGILNCVATLLVIIKYRHYPLLVYAQGIVLLGWIIIQVLFLREFNFLHLVFIILGAALIASGLWLNKLKERG